MIVPIEAVPDAFDFNITGLLLQLNSEPNPTSNLAPELKTKPFVLFTITFEPLEIVQVPFTNALEILLLI